MRTFNCQRPSRSLQSKGLQQCIRNSRTLISEEEAGTVRGSKGGVRRPGCVQHSSKPPENALIIFSWLKVTLMLGGTGASYCSAGNNLPCTDGSVAMLKNRLYPYPLSQQGFPQMRSWEIPIPSRPPNLFRDKMEGPWLTRRLWGCGFEELLRNTLSYIFILKKTRGGGAD